MAHAFEIRQEADIEAAPEEVWEAIATGPGMDSWFMGRNEIEPREGGRVGLTIADETMAATVTVWEPPSRFVSRTDTFSDGAFHQFDYRIDRRDPSSSTVRYEHTGMLSGDWEAEYEAMSQGDPMYFAKLAEYLTYFRGRHAVPVNAFGPPVASPELAMAMFRHALGIEQEAAEGDAVRFAPYGFAEQDGVIDHSSTSFLGVRTEDAMYRFIHAFTGPSMVGHHLFAEGVDQQRAERDWTAWLERLFGGAG
jgi:uncharacterized protein YndB with AHSA1/START domain